MKIEIEKSEYDRLKSREEKYLAYMDMLSYRGEDETYIDALCGKVAELEKENRRLEEEISKYNEIEEHIEDGLLTPIPNAWSHEEEIKRLKLENAKLKDRIITDENFEDKLAEENKKLKEKLSEITMVADDEKQSIEHILELEEENKKLKEDNRFLTRISKEYMEKENIVQVTEFTELYKDDLEEENKELKEAMKELNNYNKFRMQENEMLKRENKELKESMNTQLM